MNRVIGIAWDETDLGIFVMYGALYPAGHDFFFLIFQNFCLSIFIRIQQKPKHTVCRHTGWLVECKHKNTA